MKKQQLKSTPEEWTARKKNDNEWHIDTGKEPTLGYDSWKTMAIVYGCDDDDKGPDVVEANAKLIHAAPNLIKALLAVTMVTKSGQICLRTSRGVPMGMSKHKERMVRRALYKAGVIK